jgi:arylsulfatase A-like enzyme
MMDYNHGVQEERSAVPLAFDMLPKVLKTTGHYQTHMLGKWHLVRE